MDAGKTSLVGTGSPYESLAGLAGSHGKYFGTAVVHDVLFNELDPPHPDLCAGYAAILEQHFNLLVPESEMKMANVWKSPALIDFSKLDRIATWARDRGMKMRGHVLVWYRSLPPWLVAGYQDGTYSKEQVATMVAWYIDQLMGHFRNSYPGLVIAWDVVNEAVGPNDPRVAPSYGLRPPGIDYQTKGEDFWRLTLGDDYVARVFNWAHDADPDAVLYYNDYHNEYSNPKGEAIFDLVEGLQAKDVPIDGIGLQCHFEVSYLDMSYPGMDFSLASLGDTIDRWTVSGLDVQLTEVDIGRSSNQEARQAAFFGELLSLGLRRDGVSAFVTWGFTDLVSWRADQSPLYFDRNLEPKAGYQAMLKVLEAW